MSLDDADVDPNEIAMIDDKIRGFREALRRACEIGNELAMIDDKIRGGKKTSLDDLPPSDPNMLLSSDLFRAECNMCGKTLGAAKLGETKQNFSFWCPSCYEEAFE